MLARHGMSVGAQALAAIFGGAGMFYFWLGFRDPAFAAKALVYLAIASGLVLSMQDAPVRGARAAAPAWWRRLMRRIGDTRRR